MARRFFLIGRPVAHSLSPGMYRAAFAALGVDWTYEAVEVAPGQVAAALRRLERDGGRGVNVTMPHKEEAFRAARSHTAMARLVGAVNCLRLDTWQGDNTDAPGLERALEEAAGRSGASRGRGRAAPAGHPLAPGGRAVVFGAGGAARAAAFALARRGLGVTVVNRDPGRARALAAVLPSATAGRGTADPGLPRHQAALWGGAAAEDAVARAAVVVNATPLGLGDPGGRSPVPAEWRVPAGALVCDLVYRPAVTPLLEWAGERGALPVSGLEVLLWQGVLAMKFWGLEAPVEAMRAALAAAGEGPGG